MKGRVTRTCTHVINIYLVWCNVACCGKIISLITNYAIVVEEPNSKNIKIIFFGLVMHYEELGVFQRFKGCISVGKQVISTKIVFGL